LTQRNALANQLADAITTHRSDGYSHGMIAARAPYDTVLCNVLAEPVIRWAPSLASSLKEGGFAIVSGMLAWQVEAVEAAHVANNLSRITAVQQGDWVTLLLYKDAIAGNEISGDSQS
jgi:ribosomal protein L11 methyltransferase